MSNQTPKQTLTGSAADFPLPSNPDRAIEQMMDVIGRLRGVLLDEIDALEKTDMERFSGLQDRKVKMARQYQAGVIQIIGRKDEMKSASAALKRRLEEMRVEFGAVSQKNIALIDRVRRGMQSLGERIMEIARETALREQQFAYGARGHMSNGGKATMGINESV